MAETTPTRRPYTGSCHCGALRYIIYLTLPHTPPRDRRHGQQAIYRCNCTACHKAGILHTRVHSSPDDFLLLSPAAAGGDPFVELGDYQCDKKELHFFFCRTCAVRCFVFMGEGETVTIEDEAVLAMDGVRKAEEGEEVKAWRPKKDGWQEGKAFGCYLSVNAETIDQGQEGFDLREWREKEWILYLDVKRSGQPDQGMPRYERPHPGGIY